MDIDKKFKEMKRLYNPERSEAENFYRQGMSIKDVEGKPESYVPFNAVNPFYNDMTKSQLACYLGLRQLYRQRVYPQKYDSYLQLYLSEIINGIGIDPEEAEVQIRLIQLDFKKSDLSKYRQAYELIYGDFDFNHDMENDMHHLDPQSRSKTKSFFASYLRYAHININNSIVYKDDEKEYRKLFYVLYQAINKLIPDFFEKNVAHIRLKPMPFLDKIYFYDAGDHPIKSVICKDDHWYLKRYESAGNQKLLKDIFLCFDCMYAYKDGYMRTLTSNCPENIRNLIMQILNYPAHNDRIRQMMSMYNRRLSAVDNFKKQAQFMADYEEKEKVSAVFSRGQYYMDYTYKQLKYYFSWRSEARKGNITKNTYCMKLYVSEILNDVGIKDHREGLLILKHLLSFLSGAQETRMKKTIEEYIIRNEMADHYHELSEYSSSLLACHLDPHTVHDDAELMTSIRTIVSDFGRHHCLFKGNEEKNDAVIVAIYRRLTNVPWFFKTEIAKIVNRRRRFFESYVYDDTSESHQVIIHPGYIYEKKYINSWVIHIYKGQGHLADIDQLINEYINQYYGFQMMEDRGDDLSRLVKKCVDEVLDNTHLKINDPFYQMHNYQNDIIHQIAAVRAVSGENQIQIFIRQGLMMADWTIDEAKEDYPEYEVASYEELNDAQLRYYLYLRTCCRRDDANISLIDPIFTRLFINEIINDIGQFNETKGYYLLKSYISYIRWPDDDLNRILHDYELLHHLPLSDTSETENDQAIMNIDVRYAKNADDYYDRIRDYSFRLRYYGTDSELYKKNASQFKKILFGVMSQLQKHENFYEQYVAMKECEEYTPYDTEKMKILYLPESSFDAYDLNPIRRFYKKGNSFYLDYYTRPKDHNGIDYVIFEINDQACKLLDLPNRLIYWKDALDERTEKMIRQSLAQELGIENEEEQTTYFNRDLYKQMISLYDSQKSKAENFIVMGRYIENVKTEHNYKTLKALPSNKIYNELSYDELSQYLFVRERLKQHRPMRQISSYLRFYLSEVINGIGVNQSEALYTLAELSESGPEYVQNAYHDYIIVNEVYQYYDELIDENFIILDSDRNDQALLQAVNQKVKNFANHHILYLDKDNQQRSEMMGIYVYRKLLMDDDFGRQMVILTEKKVTMFKGLIYPDEKENRTVIINNHLHYEHYNHQWYKYSDQINVSFLEEISTMINRSVDAYYHLADDLDDPLYKKIKTWVSDYIESYHLQPKSKADQFLYIHPSIYQKFLEMRQVSGKDEGELFLKQGRILADIEIHENIDWDYNQFMIIPELLYSKFSDKDLITYVYLRTKIRSGKSVNIYKYDELTKLYCREIVNGIGVSSPDEVISLFKIMFDQGFVYKSSYIYKAYVLYALMHHKSVDYDQSDEWIMNCDVNLNKNADEFFDHINAVDTFGRKISLLKSPIYKKNPELYKTIFYELFKDLDHQRDLGFRKYILGERRTEMYFDAANFFINLPDHMEGKLLSPVLRIYLKGNKFYRESYNRKWTQTFCNVVHEIERHLRDMLKIGSPLKTWGIRSDIDQAIVKFLTAYLSRRHPIQQKKITIHLDDLHKIREDANVTTTQLITEEEKAMEEEETETIKEKQDSPLTADELFILKKLMHHESISDYLKSHHLMASITADSINEKLFDEIGDNVIEFDGDTPVIVDDYIEDLKDII